jgi:predicted AlkP superfamily phosphohydrolase/phosphomutase
MLAFLQFDAPALPVLERMLAEGRLPTLAGLRERGTWRELDTNAAILQSATYPTLATGVDVTHHGLYSAFPWSPSRQRVRFVHRFPKPPALWERVTAAGRRSLVVDPVLGWAPRSMAGLYLSGWNFEDRMLIQGRSVPRFARRRLGRRHGAPPHLDDVYGRRAVTELVRLREHLLRAPGRTADLLVEELRRGAYDFLWANFSSAHKAGHHLWDPGDAIVTSLDESSARSLRAGLEEVYAAVDSALGRVLSALPDDADLVVFSPTGMGANTSRADLLPRMLSSVVSGRPSGAPDTHTRTPVWGLRARIPRTWRSRLARALPDRVVADVTTRLYLRADWRRTRAFAPPGENKGYVRLNLAGRERDGIVDPGRADELLDTIARGLLTFRDVDGSPAIAGIARMHELVGSDRYAPNLPDLVVFWRDHASADVSRVDSDVYGEIVRHGVGSGRSGNHVDDAWALLLPARARLRDLGREPRVTDLAATACALLGADRSGLSGEPLLEASQ